MLSVSLPPPEASLWHHTQHATQRPHNSPADVLACLTCWPLARDFLELEESSSGLPQQWEPPTLPKPEHTSELLPPLSSCHRIHHTQAPPCSVLLQASSMSSQKLCLRSSVKYLFPSHARKKEAKSLNNTDGIPDSQIPNDLQPNCASDTHETA